LLQERASAQDAAIAQLQAENAKLRDASAALTASAAVDQQAARAALAEKVSLASLLSEATASNKALEDRISQVGRESHCELTRGELIVLSRSVASCILTLLQASQDTAVRAAAADARVADSQHVALEAMAHMCVKAGDVCGFALASGDAHLCSSFAGMLVKTNFAPPSTHSSA
jgi:hypothetical protein